MRVRAHHYISGDLIDLDWEEDHITEVSAPSGERAPDIEADWVAPALFDLQINGCVGKAFASPDLTAEDIHKVVEVCASHGISGLCPTLITSSHETFVHGFHTLARARSADHALGRAIPAFHLEGPYISPEDGPRGAHAREHVRPPCWEEFCRLQEAAEGRIRLLTLSPEYPEALPFIEKVVSSGVVVAIGHTAAAPGQIREAISAGARLSTHLGNGSHAMLPRHENYLWEQLGADELWASIITDGFHLPASVVRCMVRVKTPARLILTCDASSLAGLPPGRYREWGQNLEVLAGGKVIVPGTPFLAGSGVFTDTCIRRLIEWTGLSLKDALDMAGARPRELLGLHPVELTPGSPADLVFFRSSTEEGFAVTGTVIAGTAMHRVT